MTTDLKASIIRILDVDGGTVGTGFVLTEDIAVTCAHVVESAGSGPGDVVRLVFHATGNETTATVEPEGWRDSNAEDIAILRLEGALLRGITSLPLGPSTNTANHEFITFGFPDLNPVGGIPGGGQIVGETKLNGVAVLTIRSQEVTGGFSGAPVFDTVNQRVIGMISATANPDSRGRLGQTAFITPLEVINDVYPLSLQNLDQPSSKFLDWLIKTNAKIHLPNLKISIPISKAWTQVCSMDSSQRESTSQSLTAQIRNYQEWYRLADTGQKTSNRVDVISVIRNERLVVIVGGPGSGKSTLLRRLTYTLANEKKVVLRVSLRAIALRMKKGDTFDEALFVEASDGFSNGVETLNKLLHSAIYLFADGLDETGRELLETIDKLQRWASAVPERRVVITTRPIDHNSSWFAEWQYFELLPLNQSDTQEITNIIFGELYLNNPELATSKSDRFLKTLDHSRTASIASRNPQLLTFLIALYEDNYDISGNRFDLFSRIVERIKDQASPDRRLQQEIETPIAQRVVECIGWLMLHQPDIAEEELVSMIGQQLASDLSVRTLQGEKIASTGISFLKERGLLEELSVKGEKFLIFVHTAFQEFAATKFLEKLSDREFVEWLQLKWIDPTFRETLLFSGGTERVELAIVTLLKLDDPTDPVATIGLLAADILAEAKNPSPHLQKKLLSHLLPRLASQIPMVAYEAGEKVRPLATINPRLMGPLALELAHQPQSWTKEIACSIGLLSGDNYVDIDVLQEVFPTANDTGSRPGRNSTIIIDHYRLIQDLIIKGAEYLLKSNVTHHYKIVQAKYEGGNHSLKTHQFLDQILRKYLTPEELTSVRVKSFRHWNKSPQNFILPEINEVNQNRLEADKALMEAILQASKRLIPDQKFSITASIRNSITQLCAALEIDECPALDIYALRKRPLQESIIEVVFGVILAASLDPAKLHVEAKHLLDELEQTQEPLSYLAQLDEKTSLKIDLNWNFASGQLDIGLLLKAINHPTWFVCNNATLLLLNCFDHEVVQEGLKEILANGTNYAIEIISQIASDIWGEEAYNIILSRLEQNFTGNCAPLVKRLGEICQDTTDPRFIAVLRGALDFRDSDVVLAALTTIERLGFTLSLDQEVKQSYDWWFQKSIQDPIEGKIVVVPANPAADLLSHLVNKHCVGFEEIREATNANRADIRKVAIKAIGEFLLDREELIEPVLNAVANGELSSNIIDELSKSHPFICAKNLQGVLKLLDSDIQKVRIACIRALGDGWAEHNEVENILQSLLNEQDIHIQDEAVHALRKLIGFRLVIPGQCESQRRN